MFQAGILSFVIIGVAIVTDAKCPPKFEDYNMACHHFGTKTVANVDEAFMICSRLDGYLLNINAKAEYDYIVQRLGNARDSYWTGGQWTGKWKWVNLDKTGYPKYNIIDPNQYNQYSCQQYNDGNHFNASPEDNLVLLRYGFPVTSCIEPFSEYTTGFSYICEADWNDEW